MGVNLAKGRDADRLRASMQAAEHPAEPAAVTFAIETEISDDATDARL